MGIPGASEREMSAALSDNHSPASAEEIQKPQLEANLLPSSFNGNSNNHLASPHGSKADLSSDDIDVTSTDDYEQKPLAPPRPPEPNLAERLKRLRTYVISPLFKHVKSAAFREPVNAKALGIYPAYYQIIKQPMDLGTIRKKIDRGEYRSRSECVDDINLVWYNAKTFNAPGHFVHEAARILEVVTRDKVAKLEKDEADGVFSQPKPAKKAPDASARDRVLGHHHPDTPAAAPRPERRTVRKISQDLPGESAQPQQLKKKYVENLSDQMKQCDVILKELMTVKLHQGYVEPFLHVSRKYKGDSYDPMDLYKIQLRLQSNFYRHPLQFGNDFRRMITETYRFNHPKDPIVAQASNLQHNFELLFSRVMYEPVENPAAYDITNEDDSMLSQLMAAQTQVLTIQNSVAELLRDLLKMRAAKIKSSGGALKRRGRPASSSGPSPNSKRPRAQPQQQKQPASKMPLTAEESIALRAEVAALDEDQQQRIVQIMVENNEALTTDDNGYTEIDLGSCEAKTVRQIQAFIKKVKTKKVSPAKAKKKPVTAAPVASPVKTPKKEAGNLSDSSSDSSDSSSSSSSSDSDSE